MVIGHFGNDFSWPYFLIHQCISVVYADNKIDARPKDERLVIGNIEIEKKGVFIEGIEAKWEFFLLNSFNGVGVSVDLINAEPIF